MRKLFETTVILFGTLGWWGFVYPELCLLESGQETEHICEEQNDAYDEVIEVTEFETDSGKKRSRDTADGNTESHEYGQIRIKSKIVEYICQIKENTVAEKEVQDDKQKCPYWGF